MKSQHERQGERISIAMPIQVFGTEITGRDFMEVTQTQVLCRDGASIILTHRLAPMQQITVRNVSTGVEAHARVIGEVSARPEARVYGITLLDSGIQLWNVNFPAGEAAVACPSQQRWLECNGCQGRELASLGTLECDVFQSSRSLTRHCKWCEQHTVWHLASHDAPADKRKLSEPPRTAQVPSVAEANPGRSARKHDRVQMKLTACVREPGFGIDDFVQVENVSRGGLSFLSANAYRPGALIEVAAPYMKGAANVFTLARVKRSELQKDSNFKLYGAVYVKNSEQV
ncbi:MAG TPA: PilZ domain-containing protein [Candidatus Acidoferrales bacterium]|nr:PilZ domain-containing protein [Candidatus Acidoferrales bacterium]